MSRESVFSWTITKLIHRYMNAAKYGLDRVYFGGCFIRGKPYLLDVQVGS